MLVLIYHYSVCVHILRGLEINHLPVYPLGKWLMLGAYIRASPPRGART